MGRYRLRDGSLITRLGDGGWGFGIGVGDWGWGVGYRKPGTLSILPPLLLRWKNLCGPSPLLKGVETFRNHSSMATT